MLFGHRLRDALVEATLSRIYHTIQQNGLKKWFGSLDTSTAASRALSILIVTGWLRVTVRSRVLLPAVLRCTSGRLLRHRPVGSPGDSIRFVRDHKKRKKRNKMFLFFLHKVYRRPASGGGKKLLQGYLRVETIYRDVCLFFVHLRGSRSTDDFVRLEPGLHFRECCAI